MSSYKYICSFIMMLGLQLVLTKYCQIGGLIMISLLPAMTLSLSTARSSAINMMIMAATAFMIDFLSDGVIGLNCAAIIPAVAIQKIVIKMIIGGDVVERGYSISFWGNGFLKIFLSLLLLTLTYFIIYTCLDCAGSGDFLFIFRKVMWGSVASMIFGLVAFNILCPRPQR